MPYVISTIPHKNYLHVKVRGQNHPATVSAYLLEVARMCKEQNYSAVLIEEFLSGPTLSMSDVFNIVRTRSSDALFFSHIAYVDINDGHERERMNFAEMVALNEGVQVRVFQNVRDAEEWLDLSTNE